MFIGTDILNKRAVTTAAGETIPLHSETELTLGVSARCVTFQKIASNERQWDWWESF